MKNSIYQHYINNFDNKFGLDYADIKIGHQSIVGTFDKSPLEERIVSNFNYSPNIDAEKTYKAQWSIYDSKLHLLFVNGEINGVRLYTTDIVSEYPDDTVFYFCQWYCGDLKFNIQQNKIPSAFSHFTKTKNFLLLTIKYGLVIKIA